MPESLPYLVEKANTALEQVLVIVPEEDLDKGREMVSVLRSAAAKMSPGDEGASDAEAKAIQSLNGLI